MLHILWLAVKFIGMLLGLLLAVLLLAALLLLFCPLRYRVKIQKTVDTWEVRGRVSWLFGLVSVAVQRGSAGADTQIRICGIRLASVKKLFSREKRTARKSEEKPQEEPQRKQPEESRELEAAEERKAASAPVLAESLEEKDPKQPQEQAAKPPKESLWKRNPIGKLWMRVTEKYKSLRQFLRNLRDTIKRMRQKLYLWKNFLAKPQTGEAFRLAAQQLFRLLRHAGPQKWEGSVNLGLEDPAATGQVLAALGALYPLYRGKFLVNPIWDRKILEGNARVKGRIYGVMLLYRAGRLFFDKNVKYVVSWLRQQLDFG